MQVRIRLEGITKHIGVVDGVENHEMVVSLPDQFEDQHLKQISVDTGILHRNFGDKPESMSEILKCFTAKDLPELIKCMEKYGFSEKKALNEGGGLWLAIAVGAALLLYSQDLR